MAGVNTEVVEVVVPASAQVGATVSVQVKIKNTTDAALTIMAAGAIEYGVTPWTVVVFPEASAVVAAGETQTFLGSFAMPESDVIVHGYSYYYDETEEVWVPDDEKTNGVTAVVAEVPTTSIIGLIVPMMIVVMMMSMMMKAFK